MSTIDIQNRPLERDVVGREESFFGEDLLGAVGDLNEMIRGSQVLLIGGAGSIGFETLRTLLHFQPARIDVIDHNENGLAEVVRSLRSAADLPEIGGLRTLPFDYGGGPFRLWFEAGELHYDHVLNFAALKHVRTEKDPYSILAMLENNVLHLDRLSRMLSARGGVRRVFSVSTDKAANPSSMMGATKRLMEHALFQPVTPWSPGTEVASARFANVAFSNGSLLNSWQMRLTAGQPLACPAHTRRFFVSLRESGHLCTLAAFLGAHATIAIPALDPAEHLVELADVVERFLGHHGLRAQFTDDPDEAVSGVEELQRTGSWPVLLTPLDTAGEKPYEEFVGAGEVVHRSRFDALRELGYVAPADPASFPTLVSEVRVLLAEVDPTPVRAEFLKQLIAAVEPEFAASHRMSTRSLDERI